MAKKKAYRRKNRRLEMTVDIPVAFKDDEEFLEALADKMDDSGWIMQLEEDEDEDGTYVTPVPINRVKLGDLEFSPEDEE